MIIFSLAEGAPHGGSTGTNEDRFGRQDRQTYSRPSSVVAVIAVILVLIVVALVYFFFI
jgi:hypothetical protein